MNVEYLGEQTFLQEVEATGQVWVVKGGNENIYALELDRSGLSLPVWSDRERVVEFLKNQRLAASEYEPHAIPLRIFTESWLSDKMMDISELLLNIDGIASRVLVLTVEEFILTQILRMAV